MSKIDEKVGHLVQTRVAEMQNRVSGLVGRGVQDLNSLEADPKLGPLLKALQQPGDWNARVDAWEKITDMGPAATGWTDALQQLLYTADGWGKIFAAEALSSHACAGDHAIPVLVATLSTSLQLGRYNWARMACGALGKYSRLSPRLISMALPELLAALDAEDANVRGYAAQTLGHWGENARAAMIKLAQLSDHPADPLREHYLAMLQRIDPKISSARGALVVALGDTDTELRIRALDAIAGNGQGQAEMLPHLIPLSRDHHPEVRKYLALALARVGGGSDEVVGLLTRMGEDFEASVRLAAAYALIRLKRASAGHFDCLLNGLQSDQEQLRSLGAWALGMVGCEDLKRSMASLKKALAAERDQDVEERIRKSIQQLEQCY